MGKIIISLPLLGMGFTSTCFLHAGSIVNELKISSDKETIISNEMSNAKDGPEFKAIMEKYFGDQLKIVL